MKQNQRHKKIAEEKRNKYLFTYTKNDYNLSGKLVKDGKQIRIECIDCGFISDVVDSDLILRKSCPNCHNGNNIKIIVNGKPFRYIKNHKDLVEFDGSVYIGTYITGESLENGRKVRTGEYVFRVKCSYIHCQQEYDVNRSAFIGRYKQRCTKCCHEYTNSFAYYIKEELNEPLNLYWNFSKNIKNPYCIPKFHNEKIYINCIEHSYHEVYEISCSHFVTSKHLTIDNKKNPCSYCVGKKVHYFDSIEYTQPWMIEWFVNPEDAKKYKPGSSVSIPMKDPIHNLIIGNRTINQLYTYKGVGAIVGTRRKIGEKYFSRLFQLLNISYIPQVGSAQFSWLKDCKTVLSLSAGRNLHLKNCKYDFLLSTDVFFKEIDGKKYHIILEIDDSTHKTGIKDRTIADMCYIDSEKDIIAFNNGYYVIRIPFPDLSYCDNYQTAVISSEISSYLSTYDISETIWTDCTQFALTQSISDTVQLYESQKETMLLKDMAATQKIHPNTFRNRLLAGSKIGISSYELTNYNEKIKKTVQLYNELKDTNTNKEIAAMLSITTNTLRKRLSDGAKLNLLSFQPHTPNSISLRENNKIQCICLTNNMLFDSIKDARDYIGVKYAHIGDCCLGKRKYAGKDPLTGEKLQWAYYKSTN